VTEQAADGAPVRYTFGDSELAARRLGVVAEVFAPATAAFLRDAVIVPIELAVDLGCGPGYSTHLLAEALPCGRVIGLDKSPSFISLAEQAANERVSFRLHDLASAAPPPCDLMYCRFLLTHVKDPERMVAMWAGALRPGGLVLMDEVEWIATEQPAFAAYLGIVAAMLRHESTELNIGPRLDRLGDSDSLRRRASDVRRLVVSNRDAGRMFSLNIQCWKHEPFVRATYAPDEIERLEAELKALTEGPDDRVEIEWGLRQIVLERV
jgi:trans-aconitate 2-methyltransferase